MTNRVILENSFMCLLYPFITDSEEITTHPFGQPDKFKFFRSPEPKKSVASRKFLSPRPLTLSMLKPSILCTLRMI